MSQVEVGKERKSKVLCTSRWTMQDMKNSCKSEKGMEATENICDFTKKVLECGQEASVVPARTWRTHAVVLAAREEVQDQCASSQGNMQEKDQGHGNRTCDGHKQRGGVVGKNAGDQEARSN